MAHLSELSGRHRPKGLSWSFFLLYLLVVGVVVVGVAIIQGFLSSKNESKLIDLQATQSCSAVFNAVQNGWKESILFTETVAAGFFASDLSISQRQFTGLGKSKAFKDIEAMTMLEFVHHIEGWEERKAWEASIKNEFRQHESDLVDLVVKLRGFQGYTSVDDFKMFGFDGTTPSGNKTNGDLHRLHVYDPIVYSTPFDPFLWGFFPDPEAPRIKAIDQAIKSGKFSCSGRINLFGVKENYAGIVCFMPLWRDNLGNAVASKQAGMTSAEAYGFVVPVFQMSMAMSSIFISDRFDTDIANVEIFLYDTTDEPDVNIATNNVRSSFMGRFPGTSGAEFEEMHTLTADELVLKEGAYAEVQSKPITVGEREWTVYCALTDEYFSSKKSNLPIYIGLLSVGITIGVSLIRKAMYKFLTSTQAKVYAKSMRNIEEPKA